MVVFQHVLLAVGGVVLFLFGLKTMSESMEAVAGVKMKNMLKSVTGNKISGVLTGVVSTALIQSSVATNVILVGFVSAEIMTFYQASAVIMGANIGTTVTAQLVSLSGKRVFDITAVGALVMFIGFALGFLKNKTVKSVGDIMVGFGMIFLGLDVINDEVSFFKNFEVFRSFFLVDNDLILVVNGIAVTAVLQSSSAVTSVMIVLSSNGLISFNQAMFLTLGANIGTCVSVMVAAADKPIAAKRTAFFNFAFNFVGTLVLFLPLTLFKNEVAAFFASFSNGVEREIANFHTLFNVTVTLALLPVLKPFTSAIEKIIPDKRKTLKEKRRKKGKSGALTVNKV